MKRLVTKETLSQQAKDSLNLINRSKAGADGWVVVGTVQLLDGVVASVPSELIEWRRSEVKRGSKIKLTQAGEIVLKYLA